MNSQDYWRKREEDWIKQQIKDDAKQSKAIAEKYQRSLDQIQKEIDANWERFAGKEGVSLTEAKKKALEMDVESFARKAKEYVKEKNFSKTANDELRLYNVTMRTSRLELLKSQIGLELVALSDDVDKYTAQTLTKAGAAEAKRQAGILGETVFENYHSFVDSVANGSFQGATFSERIWRSVSALKADLDKLLIRSITQGKNPREMARELRNIFGSSKYEAERLMRTETARVQTAVQQESYRQYDVEEYEFIAEPTACPICKTIDGKVFQAKKMSFGLNVPPMHPNCRCSTAPYVDREAVEKRLDEIEAFDKMTPAQKKQYLLDQMEKLEDGKWGSMTEKEAEAMWDKYDRQLKALNKEKTVYNKSEEKTISPEILMDGVKKGEQMSVSQADDHNANPAYLGRTPAERKQISAYQKEIDKLRAARAEAEKRWESLPSGTKERKEALELTNGYVSRINKLIREYDKYREKTVEPYTVNCQRCAPTYELRRRGYDVTALPNLGGKYKQVYQIPKEMWRDTDGNVSRGEMLSARSNHVVTKELMKRMKPGERGTLDWSWSRQNSGHIINVERTEGGLLIIDAQTGKQAGTFEEYMGSNKFKTKISRQKYGVFYNRVDDKYIDLDNIDIIVEGARK